MSARLKYNPASYKRLAEIAGWLARGENVQLRSKSAACPRWFAYCTAHGNIEMLLSYGCEFRIKPTKEPKQ